MTGAMIEANKRWLAAGILTVVVIAGCGLSFAGTPAPRTVALPPPDYRQPALIVSRQAIAPATGAASPVPSPSVSASPSATPLAAYTIRRVLDIPEPIRFGQWYWDEAGAPAAGRLVMTVDLAANTISVFRDGYEIGTAAVMTGLHRDQTPLGSFPITQKDADHVSNIYHGAPMPYMLRLTNDGVSIHGGDVRADGATHGCVGVPVAFAKKLFGVAKLGDVVVITRGERLALGGKVTAAR